MSQTIWKYTLSIDPTLLRIMGPEINTLDIPEGATFLSLAMQHGVIALWYLVDPDAPKQQHQYAVVGTGHPAPDTDSGVYRGTVLLMEGDLVLHVFERVTE